MEDLVVNGLDVKPINYIAEKVDFVTIVFYIVIDIVNIVFDIVIDIDLTLRFHISPDYRAWVQLCQARLCP